MRAKIYFIFLFNISVLGGLLGQALKKTEKKDTIPFNSAYWTALANKKFTNPETRAEFIAGKKKEHYEAQFHKHIEEKDIIWVPEPTANKGYGQNSINAGPCTNIDFEMGTTASWTRTTGYNPLFNAAVGCCTVANGDQTIMTGGTDVYGLFPRVDPLGGSFSLRLGSTAIGGVADRISQQFFVTPANANFTYRYAVVLNDPTSNHTTAEKPRFTSLIKDTLGQPISCTFYSVVAGGSIPGFTTSALTANGGAVRCKDWTSVAVDLSPQIGRNVTIEFTVYDCGPSGHFAYAYLDGVCTNFATSISDTTCPNVPLTICAPSGFSTTTWNGPGAVVNNTNQCIAVTVPGVYTCTTLLVPGCPGPTFSHTLNTFPSANLGFTPISSGPCSRQFTFTNFSSINNPLSLTSFIWSFGDGVTISSPTPITPTYTYALPGTYQVKFKVVSNRGCMDSVVNAVTIFPTPNLAFSPPSNCINTVIQFTNNSTISAGTIASYTWNFFGNGPNSNAVNPTNTYTANGTYTINLSATSSQGCPASLTQTLGIFPPPVISFTVNQLCDINGTSFAPATSATIVSGTLNQFFWNFGDGGTSNVQNPIHFYQQPGVYTVSFTAISNHNCTSSTNSTFSISPSPTVAFSTTSINACSHQFTFTNNSGILPPGSATYTWSFGGTNTTTVNNPTHVFPGNGNYTVMLIGESNLGCRDTAFNYISIYPLPVISLNAPASCENAILTVTATALSGSVTSYLWDFGDPLSGAANTSTLQNPTHFYSSTNIYSVTLNIVSNQNCPSSSAITLTVFPNPIASVVHTTSGNCSLQQFYDGSGSSVSNIGGSTIAGYSWNFANAGISNQVTPGNINFPAPGNYSVSMVVTTNHNCTDTISQNLVIHPFPSINFTVDAGCLTAPVNITSSSSISAVPVPGSVDTYTWNFGNGNFSPLQNPPPYTYATPNIYTISMGATSNMGCVSLVSKTVAIHPMPVVDFTPTPNMCLGNPTQFTAAVSIPTGTNFSFNWDFGDGAVNSGTLVSHTYTTIGTFAVGYSVTSNNECRTIVTKNVVIHPVPQVSFAVNGGCLGVVSNFTETSTIANSPIDNIVSWNWNFGDGAVPTPTNSNHQNPNYTYTAFGPPYPYTPTLVVTSNHGCTNSATNTVFIHPLPSISITPPGACVNSLIQFTNTSSVPVGLINSYVWDFADASPTVAATSPAHTYTAPAAYIVTVTATTNQGCVKTATSNLDIHPYPAAIIFPVFNSCINDSAFINTNISITAGTIPTHTLFFGDGAQYTPTTGLIYTAAHTYTAFNTYTLTLKAVSNFGCARTFTNSIMVYPKPFVNFTPSSFCLNTTTQFANTSTINLGYTISDYFWDFDDGGATSTAVSPGHKFIGPGVHNVSLTAFSYPETGITCSATAVKNVTINPLPQALSFISNSVCLGSPTSFSNTTIGTSSITGWSWYFNNVLTSVFPNPVFTFTSSGTQSVQLVATNNFGCKDTTDVDFAMVWTNPTASFSPVNSACFGTLNFFTNQSTAADGIITTHSWSTANNNFSNNQDASFMFGSPGTHTVQLMETTNLGCSAKFTTTVTVHHLPTITFTATEACLNTPTQFNNFTSIPIGSITAYNWNFGDPASGTNNTSALLNPIHLYSLNGNYTATLEAISNNSCTNKKAITVTVHGIPFANFTNTTICTGDNLNFANLSASSDGSIISNQWDFNGDNVIDKDQQSPSYTYSVPGNYLVRLTVTTQFGCSEDSARTVYANPKAVATFTSDNKAGCPKLCVNFKNTSTIISGSISSISWDFGDGGPLTSSQNPTNCYNSGSYDVKLTVISDVGCKTELNHPGYVAVYPEPKAGFQVLPDEIDEDDPTISVSSLASSDVNYTKYYINDGSSYGTPNFIHSIKNLKKTNPMLVQIVKNQFGCVDTVFEVLKIKPAFAIYFPNVFTPNGDGTNDTYMPKGVGILKFSIQIYDRWGHQVFKSNDITDTWDGTSKGSSEPIKQDVYTWKAQVTDVFNKNHSYVGHVSLIR